VKIGLLGDIHLTNRSPRRRLDDYFETLMDKLDQAFAIFDDAGCEFIVQAGDVCDSPTIANRVKSSFIRFLRHRLPLHHSLGRVPLYSVFGQHDVSGHSVSTLPNSPLAVFEASGVMKLLGSDPVVLESSKAAGDVVELYGASFGQEIPVPRNPDAYNILVIHASIGSRPLFPGQELVGPRKFLRDHPEYRLVVCGDYHYRFIDSWESRVIVNPGALVRKTISKFDLEHRPAVVVFDTGTSDANVVELNVKPIEEVFALEEVGSGVSGDKYAEVLKEFITDLIDGKSREVDWKEILVKVISERNCDDGVRRIIDECLEEAGV